MAFSMGSAKAMAERMAEKARAAANAAAKGTREAVGSLAAEFETNMEASALGGGGGGDSGRSSSDGGRPSTRSSGRPPRGESPDGDQYVKLPVSSAKKLRWYDDGDMAEVIAAHLREKMALSEETERLRSELENEIGKDETKRRLADDAAVAKALAAERARKTEDGANRAMLLAAKDEIARLRVALAEAAEKSVIVGDVGRRAAGVESAEAVAAASDGWNDGWDGSDDGAFEPIEPGGDSPKLPPSTAPGSALPDDDDAKKATSAIDRRREAAGGERLAKENAELAATIERLESKLADVERARDDAEAEADAATAELAQIRRETETNTRRNEITFGTSKEQEDDADRAVANEALRTQLERLRAEAMSKGAMGAKLEAEVEELQVELVGTRVHRVEAETRAKEAETRAEEAETRVKEAETRVKEAEDEAAASIRKAEEGFEKNLRNKTESEAKAKKLAEDLLKKNQALAADLSEAKVRADAFSEKADELEKTLLKERERRKSDGELATEHEAALAKAEKDAEWAVARVEELEAKLAERAEDVEGTEDFAAAAQETIQELEKAVEASETRAKEAETRAKEAEASKSAAIAEAEASKSAAIAEAEEAKTVAEEQREEMQKRTSKAEIDAKALRLSLIHI